MKQYSTPYYYLSWSALCQQALSALLLCLSFNVAATELDMVLAKQEQQLLHIAEQQRQLQTLNSLLPAMQQLADYPQDAIELLIDNNPLGRLSMDDRKLLKQVINALRPQPIVPALPTIAEVPPPTEPEPVNPDLTAEVPPPAEPEPVNPDLKPVLALLSEQNVGGSGRVVFQPADGQPLIVAHSGYSFQHQGNSYQLLDIQIADRNGAVEQFAIRLQTPQGINTYLLPESL